jgi:hypothetical protein
MTPILVGHAFCHHHLFSIFLGTTSRQFICSPCFSHCVSVMTLVARIVGELACQQNSYLNELQTTVISCVEVTAAKSETKRTKKNKDKDQKSQIAAVVEPSSAMDGRLWEVECQDSILFPEGSLSSEDRIWNTIDGLR